MEAKTEKTINLSMTEEEAIWLRDAMQNPFHADETTECRNHRKDLFTALKDI